LGGFCKGLTLFIDYLEMIMEIGIIMLLMIRIKL
jgi:hypothetical protein